MFLPHEATSPPKTDLPRKQLMPASAGTLDSRNASIPVFRAPNLQKDPVNLAEVRVAQLTTGAGKALFLH